MGISDDFWCDMYLVMKKLGKSFKKLKGKKRQTIFLFVLSVFGLKTIGVKTVRLKRSFRKTCI